ncbi:MAG: hypothetical protein RR268_04195 [Kiritimatiellia bacterium]
MNSLILDRSTEQTFAAYNGRCLTVNHRDDAWVEHLRTFLNGECPEALVVGLGPGSFAGIRGAIACLQGMGLGWGIPVKGFPSAALFALASGQPHVTVVGDARRGTLWVVRYSVTDTTLIQEEDFHIVQAEHFVPSAEMVSPDAERLAKFGLRKISLKAELLAETVRRLGETLTPDPIPLYLHPAVGCAHAE